MCLSPWCYSVDNKLMNRIAKKTVHQEEKKDICVQQRRGSEKKQIGKKSLY